MPTEYDFSTRDSLSDPAIVGNRVLGRGLVVGGRGGMVEVFHEVSGERLWTWQPPAPPLCPSRPYSWRRRHCLQLAARILAAALREH